MPINWSQHHALTREKPPSALLVRALPYVEHRNRAIDIGAGALKDTRYLLALGFEVTALDAEPSMTKEAQALMPAKLHWAVSTYADFPFPAATFDIASACYSLPFNPPDTFAAVFARITSSLVVGDGIFCGQLFGTSDEWSGKRPGMTFHTRAQVEQLLADTDLEIISLEEIERDATLANGTPKHWHVFDIIARKRKQKK